MSSRRGNDMEEGASFKADPSAKIDPSKDLTEESKAEWLKRRAKEDRKHQLGQKVVSEWFEIIAGKKLVKKLRKKNGGVYSIYVGNTKKPDVKEFLRTLKKGTDGKYTQEKTA